mmetsp:Transcript_56356/g.115262  ORF Transcript_56356/g.115262 Transcript_56356/m.115262 type:complete len:263 (+) Transcript_56356:233-1021(+)
MGRFSLHACSRDTGHTKTEWKRHSCPSSTSTARLVLPPRACQSPILACMTVANLRREGRARTPAWTLTASGRSCASPSTSQLSRRNSRPTDSHASGSKRVSYGEPGKRFAYTSVPISFCTSRRCCAANLGKEARAKAMASSTLPPSTSCRKCIRASLKGSGELRWARGPAYWAAHSRACPSSRLLIASRIDTSAAYGATFSSGRSTSASVARCFARSILPERRKCSTITWLRSLLSMGTGLIALSKSGGICLSTALPNLVMR